MKAILSSIDPVIPAGYLRRWLYDDDLIDYIQKLCPAISRLEIVEMLAQLSAAIVQKSSGTEPDPRSLYKINAEKQPVRISRMIPISSVRELEGVLPMSPSDSGAYPLGVNNKNHDLMILIDRIKLSVTVKSGLRLQRWGRTLRDIIAADAN